MKYEGIEFSLVDIDSLKEHEEIYPEKVKELAEEIKRDGVVKKPILVDKEHMVILDGHHRYQALKMLGCKKVPAFLVDYLHDDRIKVTLWPTAKISSISKELVVKTALEGKKFTPKTSRHIVEIELPEIETELERLYRSLVKLLNFLRISSQSFLFIPGGNFPYFLMLLGKSLHLHRPNFSHSSPPILLK